MRVRCCIVVAGAIAGLALLAGPHQASALELGPLQRLTAPEERPRSSDVAMDKRGDAYAAWSSRVAPRDGRGSTAHFAALDAEGRPKRVLDLGAARRVFIQIATAPNGTSFVVFPNRRGGRPRLQLARIERRGRTARSVTISPEGQPVDPFSIQVEATPDGGAFVTWVSGGVRVVHIDQDGRVGPVQTVSTKPVIGTNYEDGADLAVDGRGRAVLAWAETDPPTPGIPRPAPTIQLARVDENGQDGTPMQVGTDAATYGVPQVALADDGTIDLAYQAVFGSPYSPIPASTNFLVRVSPADEVAPPVFLYTEGGLQIVEMTMNSIGAATVAVAREVRVGKGFYLAPAAIVIAPDGTVGRLHDIGDRVSREQIPAFYLASDRSQTVASWTTHQPGQGRRSSVEIVRVLGDGSPGPVARIGSGYASGLALSGRGPAALVQRRSAGRPLYATVPAGP